MSKTKRTESDDVVAEATVAATAENEPEQPLQMFECRLNCPTPLAHPTAIVEAVDEQEARSKFFALNGIDASTHEFTATLVA